VAERVRIQKALSAAGLMSRRAADEAISAGRVQVDGVTAVLGDRIDVESQVMTVDGRPVPVDPAKETYLLYKPVGVISTASDPQGRETVVDMVDSKMRLYPVGRLDADSEGLILLTNDGDLANRVTHPRYGIRKQYLVMLRPPLGKEALGRLTSGIDLEDGRAAAVSARIVDRLGDRTLVEMVMAEGRNREIRRMFEAMGHEVVSLVRTGIGPLRAPDLEPGRWRRLSNREIQSLLASGSE
jgi:23S rRNA pseudouridine2605 synthase